MKAVLAYLKIRATELTSIAAASGASGILIAYLLGQVDGRTALASCAAALVAYLLPQPKKIPAAAPTIAAMMFAGGALMACVSPAAQTELAKAQTDLATAQTDVQAFNVKAKPVVNATACTAQEAANVATAVLAVTDPPSAAASSAASQLLGLVCFTTKPTPPAAT